MDWRVIFVRHSCREKPMPLCLAQCLLQGMACPAILLWDLETKLFPGSQRLDLAKEISHSNAFHAVFGMLTTNDNSQFRQQLLLVALALFTCTMALEPFLCRFRLKFSRLNLIFPRFYLQKCSSCRLQQLVWSVWIRYSLRTRWIRACKRLDFSCLAP